MDEPKLSDTRPLAPPPSSIALRLGGKNQKVSYEQAFVLAFSLLQERQPETASQVFERLEKIPDHGPRAFIMHAFCEAAALHFESCSKPLVVAFDGSRSSIAGDLHNAFVSYHVGIRQDAGKSMADLVNQHRDLPTLCLLLGTMFHAGREATMARKCWSLAIKRDYPNGAVALVAAQQLHNAATK